MPIEEDGPSDTRAEQEADRARRVRTKADALTHAQLQRLSQHGETTGLERNEYADERQPWGAGRVSEITVTRPNPQTGEVEVQVVPADHFDVKLPKKPLDGDEQATAEYWSAYASMLTREERRSISNGAAHVVRPASYPPQWEKGDVLEVAANLTAEVLEMTRTLKGIATKFRVIDLRPWLLKQTVGGGGRPQVDEHGFPVEPTPGAIDAARVDGAYTRSPALAVKDSGDVMDDKLTRRLQEEAGMVSGRRRKVLRGDAKKLRLEEAIAEARTKHRKSTAKRLERELKSMGESVA